MTIQITNPEVEALIDRRLESGAFEDAEEVILQALRSFSAEELETSQSTDLPQKSIVELFAPLRGLDIDFSRNPSTGRPVDLS
jgi:hypothetical protein